jgi:hypothetical protein
MLRAIRFHLRIAALQRRRDQTGALFAKDIASAERRNDQDAIEEARSTMFAADDMIAEEIRTVTSGRLLSLAEKYMLPFPKSSLWEMGDRTGKYSLKQEAMQELRSAIRREERERSESLLRWTPLWIGLIGALTGLVAVMSRLF